MNDFYSALPGSVMVLMEYNWTCLISLLWISEEVGSINFICEEQLGALSDL